MRVEFLQVCDDRTWDTVVETVPDFLTSPQAPDHRVLENWANENLPSRGVAFFHVYCAPYTADDLTHYDHYALLEVDEGDECPMCESGTIGHERRGEGKHSTLIAVCRGECGESATFPDFICPKCQTTYGGAAAQHRVSIEENGWCLDCEVEKAPLMNYKVWVHVEEICEGLDHYQDVDLSYGAVAKLNRMQSAVAFADMLHHLGKTIAGADQADISRKHIPAESLTPEGGELCDNCDNNPCICEVSSDEQDQHRGDTVAFLSKDDLDEHAPNLVAEAQHVCPLCHSPLYGASVCREKDGSVATCLDLCTSHVPRPDERQERQVDFGSHRAVAHEHGWTVFPLLDDDDGVYTPDWFKPTIELARRVGARVINYDSDALVRDDLPKWEW